MTEKVKKPESIRTPGKTWTEYPELGTSKESPEVMIEEQGDVRIMRGKKASNGKHFSELVDPEKNSYNLHHYENLDTVIYVRAKGDAEVNIEYQADSSTSVHLVVETAKNSEITVTEKFSGDASTITSVGEFVLGENSVLEYGGLERTSSETFYSSRRALAGRDSGMRWLNSFLGSGNGIHRSKTLLEGENSSAEMKTLWFATDQQKTDAKIEVEHLGEKTRCKMDSRGVADDRSRTVYEGLQEVGRNASDTSSFQSEDSLLISDNAEVDASPKLMIENNDVEASHSASAGRVPDEELHYMKTRGIDEERARKLLVESFFEPMLQGSNINELEDDIREEISEKL